MSSGLVKSAAPLAVNHHHQTRWPPRRGRARRSMGADEAQPATCHHPASTGAPEDRANRLARPSGVWPRLILRIPNLLSGRKSAAQSRAQRDRSPSELLEGTPRGSLPLSVCLSLSLSGSPSRPLQSQSLARGWFPGRRGHLSGAECGLPPRGQSERPRASDAPLDSPFQWHLHRRHQTSRVDVSAAGRWILLFATKQQQQQQQQRQQQPRHQPPPPPPQPATNLLHPGRRFCI